MSVILARDGSFLGVPLIKVRNVLKAWRRGDRSDIWRIAARKDVGLDPRTVFVLLEELRDRGLMGPVEQECGLPHDDLTEDGLALAGAIARKRVARAQAQRTLDRFLDACTAVNARDDLPFDVREVWLFGSMIDANRDEVADIDIVAVYGRPDGFDRRAAKRRFQALAKKMGATPQHGVMSIFGDEMFVKRQLLHGGRRHPLLSMLELDDLHQLGCPCRLVFDASRAGKVSDPVLDRHPSSPGKSNQIGDRHHMPDLATGRGPLRPVDSRLMASRHIYRPMIKAIGPWFPGHGYYALLCGAQMPIIVTDGMPPLELKANALKKRARFPSCDGRDRVGLWLTETVQVDPSDWRKGFETIPMAMATIERSILRKDRSVRYSLDVVDADHLGQAYDVRHLLMLEWWLHLMVTTDVERIVRREIEEGMPLDVEVIVANTANRRIAEGLRNPPELCDHPYVAEARARLGTVAQAPSDGPCIGDD